MPNQLIAILISLLLTITVLPSEAREVPDTPPLMVIGAPDESFSISFYLAPMNAFLADGTPCRARFKIVMTDTLITHSENVSLVYPDPDGNNVVSVTKGFMSFDDTNATTLIIGLQEGNIVGKCNLHTVARTSGVDGSTKQIFTNVELGFIHGKWKKFTQ